MSIAQRERAALVATMDAVGPERPTLAGEWTARELAAHLVIRERRLDAAAGLLVPALSDYTERVTQQVAAQTDWTVLLDQIRSGPPLLSPFKLLDPVINVSEMFIHHEDVRRGVPGWEPRELDEAADKALTRQVAIMARLALSKTPGQVVLRTPEGKTLATRGNGKTVVVTGAPLELLLFASGRDETRVEFEGDAETIAAVKAGRGGL